MAECQAICIYTEIKSEPSENHSLDDCQSANLENDSFKQSPGQYENCSVQLKSENHVNNYSITYPESENQETLSTVSFGSENHETFPLSIVETEFCLPEGEAIFPDSNVMAVSSTGSGSGRKKQLNALTLESKIQVLKDSEAGLSHRQLAEKYRCGKTQIGTILKQKNELKEEWALNANRRKKRKRTEPYEVVNQLVWEWYQTAKLKDLPINGPILQAKAKEYAFVLEMSSFSASNGWLDSFRRRHNIVFRRASSKCNNSNSTPDEIHNWKSQVNSFLTEYSPKDIYTVHETRLLFRTVPDQSISNDSKIKRCSQSRERLTLVFCCNAVGEKETLLVISKHFMPWYLHEIDSFKLGIKWYLNKKTWLTDTIFKEFLESFNEKMKIERRKIILFIKELTCDLSAMDLSNVSIKLLPSLTSSYSDPFDLGIENAFKLSYRKRLLKALITRTSGETTINEIAVRITILQAIKWVLFSWMEVGSDLISKCFKMSVIMSEKKPNLQWTHYCDDEYKSLCFIVGISSACQENDCLNHLLHKQELNLSPPPLSLPNLETINDDDSDNSENEQDPNNLALVVPLPLEESLKNISQLREVFHKFCSLENQSKILGAVDLIETELEDIIVKHKLLNFL